MKYFNHIFKHLAAMLLFCGIMAAATACQDDTIFDKKPANDGPEGVPTSVNLSVRLADMDIRSRAAIAENDARNIRNLWVGIYLKSSGERTYEHVFTAGDAGFGTPEGAHGDIDLPAISTLSGNSYIVAVANVDDNFGITDNADLHNATATGREAHVELRTLLGKADTWEKYKSISFVLTDEAQIDFSSTSNLAMSGSFHAGEVDHTTDWKEYDSEGNPEAVYIPVGDDVSLEGRIHLRRLISYIKFNIRPGNDLITVEPLSWMVHNIPSISYLQERDANSADVSKRLNTTNHDVSATSYDFVSGNLTSAAGEAITGTGHSFDFYLLENKQTAVEYAAKGDGDYNGIKTDHTDDNDFYADREREYKSDTETNTGIYKSLSSTGNAPTVGGETNNFASYVSFKVRVSYHVNRNQADVNPEEVEPVAPATDGSTVLREGYATYTVHMGYIEGSDNLTKAQDFNCRRNSRYTYNVTINGLKNIVVEAKKEGENQPGSEGSVTDVLETVIDLDAHYAVFNIQLSYNERKNLRWLVESPFDGKTISRFSEDINLTREDLENDQFYNWISFKPTTGKDVLRTYRDNEIDNPDTARPEGWTLRELADLDNLGVDASGNEVPVSDKDNMNDGDSQMLWYTVFVNEYAYRYDADGITDLWAYDSDRGGWVEHGWSNYVNQEPRKVWIACEEPLVSNDKESIYLRSKYLISQKSILTYYSTTNLTPNKTALGVERENESFGMNLAWSQTAWSLLGSPNPNNGRYNVWYYFTNGTIGNKTATDGRQWSNLISVTERTIADKTVRTTEPYSRGAIAHSKLNMGRPEDAAQTYNVPKLAAMTSSDRYTNNGQNNNQNYLPFPSQNEYYDLLTACMSRNRDENGDGIIDVNEMKWYVPTSGKYARIILGRGAFRQDERLMDFSIDQLPYVGPTASDQYGYYDHSDMNVRFHYASSDKKVIWSEEGTSSSTWLSSNWEHGAWNIRCVRNLGVNHHRVIDEDPVTPAYKHDPDKKTMSLLYYTDICKRAPVTDWLLPHDVSSVTNQPSAAFEIANEDCNSSNTTVPAGSVITLNASGELQNFYNSSNNLQTNADYTNLSNDNQSYWYQACQNNYICGGYSQEANGSDRGTWRIPNQKELVMIRREGYLTANTDLNIWLSCTQEHYLMRNIPVRRFMAVKTTNGTVAANGVSRRVRCVRDIMQ